MHYDFRAFATEHDIRVCLVLGLHHHKQRPTPLGESGQDLPAGGPDHVIEFAALELHGVLRRQGGEVKADKTAMCKQRVGSGHGSAKVARIGRPRKAGSNDRQVPVIRVK